MLPNNLKTYRMVITVDGLAGSGKTTLARELAKRLNFKLLNTGLIYRAAAFVTQLAMIAPESQNEQQIVANLAKHIIVVSHDQNGEMIALIDGQNHGAALRAPATSEICSKIASMKLVRQALIEPQKNAFANSPIVAEGRDMGTVVFPEAPVKFFVQTSLETRITRRTEQLFGNTAHLDSKQKENVISEISREIIDRDQRDQQRLTAPTIPALDAIFIDNSQQELTKVVDQMYDTCLLRDPRLKRSVGEIIK